MSLGVGKYLLGLNRLIISNVDIMNEWVKTCSASTYNSLAAQKITSLIPTLKPGKHNPHDIS